MLSNVDAISICTYSYELYRIVVCIELFTDHSKIYKRIGWQILIKCRRLTPLNMRFDRKGETAATTATAEKTLPTSSLSTVLVKMDLKFEAYFASYFFPKFETYFGSIPQKVPIDI